MAEGHYLYVNKNLIEMLACLALASTPNGLWLGLDALLFGWIDRAARGHGAESRPRTRPPTRPARPRPIDSPARPNPSKERPTMTNT